MHKELKIYRKQTKKEIQRYRLHLEGKLKEIPPQGLKEVNSFSVVTNTEIAIGWTMDEQGDFHYPSNKMGCPTIFWFCTQEESLNSKNLLVHFRVKVIISNYHMIYCWKM